MKLKYALMLSLFAAMSASAQTAHKAVSAVDQTGKDGVPYQLNYIYNDQNQLMWELREGSTRKEYEYNAEGQCVKMSAYNWIAYSETFAASNVETYEYAADGTMSKMVVEQPNGETYTYTYTKYDKDVAVEYSMVQHKPSGTEYRYDYKVAIDYDKRGRVQKLSTSEYDYDYPEDGFCGIRTVQYTYNTDGTVATETSMKYDYSFDKPKEATKSVITYTYADLDAAYAPKNLKAENNNGDVTLTWDAVEGAEAYVVTYDLQHVTVTGTQYVVSVNTGDRKFTVQSVVEGLERNGAEPVVASVVDPGKLPITDLTVGKVFETEEATESDKQATRTFFNIPLSWSLPEGHSEIEKFNVHYTSQTYGDFYVSVVNPAATSFILRVDPYEVATQDEEGNLIEGVETPIYVTIVYTTGESDKSNIVTVNPFRDLGHEQGNGIEEVSTGASHHLSGVTYNIAGQRVANGNIIIVGGKKVIK